MSLVKLETIQAKPIKVSQVMEAPWNMNVMSPEKYAQLVADMKTAGPERTDPIDTATVIGIAPAGIKRVTTDGAHRLRGAKQLGWEYIYEIYHPEIKSEEEMRLFNYKRDYERGEIDPFKLAQTFQWFEGHGFDQDKIGKIFHVDRSTVSK